MGKTGEQYEISAAGARAIITERGATLRYYESGGAPYTETFAEDAEPPLACGNILVPWPNRTAKASWTYEGTPKQLAVTEQERGNAIHGLARKRVWQVLDRETGAITLGVDIPEGEGWPVALRTEVSYRLTGDGLGVSHLVRNAGNARVPFGLGTHPYVRAGNRDNDECVLEMPVSRWLPLNRETMIPSGIPENVPAIGGATAGEIRANRPLDASFTGIEFGTDGRAHYRLVHPDGDGVELWAGPEFPWVQAFTPPEFDGRPGAVAIEPMTCPPDALNSGDDLIWLAPGAEWRGEWGIRPL
ncbi:aldose 1-epimerase family protein [Sciscionella marina]|uniref:aldose 1-epimerase family protein n=1 Tax=Sciscionella marina TaxID=508770 RepID=UPI00036AA383|nr:aldose 1-epimerase family protein [Sciscionella marina]